MAADDITLRRAAEAEAFLALVADGVGPVNAGIQVGWHPRKTKTMMKDPEFAELVAIAQDRTIEDVEQALVTVAKRGNVRAIQFFLLNRATDRWRDVRHIQIDQTHRLDAGVVSGVKEGVLEAIRSGNLAQLAPGAPIVDAEVVDDD